jgi:hypothetical protein
VRNRRVTSTAARTLRSTPAKTIALTIQVVPKRFAKVAMFLVSRSRNAAPMKKRSTYGRIARNGPPTARTSTSEMSRMPPRVHRYIEGTMPPS